MCRLFLEQKLFCSTEWTEESFLFLVLMDDTSSRLPRYVIRLPKSDQNWTTPFLGLLYFSIVAPLSGRGNPPGTVMFVEMEMIRSSDATPSVRRPDCHFPSEFLGRWVSFDRSTITQFLIESGQLSSNLTSVGTLICKIKHWAASSFYKVVAVRHNGCRPRYCCMHLSVTGDVVQYRLSGCSRLDESFDSCHVGRGAEVEDAPNSGGRRTDDINRIRTDASAGGGIGRGGRAVIVHSLLPMSNVQLSTCGLDGLFGADVTFFDDVRCVGTLDDREVTNNTCMPRSTIKFNMAACIHELPELSCVATVRLSSGNRLLITELPDGAVPCCWIVKPGADGISRSIGGLRRETSVLHRCKCNTGEIINHTNAGTDTSLERQAQMNVIKIYHYDSDVCAERQLEPSESFSHSKSTSQSRPDMLSSSDATNITPTLVQGHALHDFAALFLTSRPRNEDSSIENDEATDTNLSNRHRVTRYHLTGQVLLSFTVTFCLLTRQTTQDSYWCFDCNVL